MTKRSSKSKLPVKTVQQLSTRMPRPRFSARLSDNVSYVTGNQYAIAPVVTAGNTLGYSKITLSPGHGGSFTSFPCDIVARQYQNGLYLPGTRLDYIPGVGLNTQGTIAIAYIDSPTLMKQWATLAAGNQLSFIQGLANVRTGPIWQPLTFPLPPNTRRKDYLVDNSIVANDTNELDLAVQGYFLWVAYGLQAPSADLTVGQMVLHTKMQCRELIGFNQTQG
jgi:hypothetical protein